MKFSFDIVGTKGNNAGAVAVLVDVDDSTQAELEEQAAINESVSVQNVFFVADYKEYTISNKMQHQAKYTSGHAWNIRRFRDKTAPPPAQTSTSLTSTPGR